MINIKRNVIKLISVCAVLFPQVCLGQHGAAAEPGAEFLKSSQASQHRYFDTALGALMVAASNSEKYKHVGDCIGRLYFGKNGSKQGYAHISEKIAAFPTFHPQVIIYGVMKKQCGGFD